MKTWISETLGEGVHALTGGAGSTVVLLSGWPETADSYLDVFPFLTEHHRVLAVDPPGLGRSAPSLNGYDTGNVSALLTKALGPALKEEYHLVGHDVGAWIAYAWASQFPTNLKSLTVLDSALPGLGAPQSFPPPYEVNIKLWQMSFNTLPDLPEILTLGRERELFDWLFQHKAVHPERISLENRDRYVECYTKRGGMSRGFAYYRAAAQSAAQNLQFCKQKLAMPVLALGGRMATGDNLRKSMESVADHVEGGVIEDCGHYVMEEQPEIVSRTLLRFFAQSESREL